MASAAAEQAVRAYLGALKDPSSLRDDERIAKLERELERSNDQLERVLLQQQLLDAKSPSVEQFEEAFIEHARSWAEEHGVSPSAFQSEGVPSTVLRRAGFQVRGGRARGRAARRRSAGRRTRVSADEVRKAIPRGTFTIREVQERSGASTAVVRRVVQEELEAGRVSEAGTAPDHSGPGRAPALYEG
jgi:hypothetical protein